MISATEQSFALACMCGYKDAGSLDSHLAAPRMYLRQSGHYALHIFGIPDA